MFYTFSYDGPKHELRISSKLWSDFGAHIPLIRSFSYGPNLSRVFHAQPVESPLFPREPIRYHFGFYALVGILEKLGIRIDWALNIPSALGFTALLILIYALSYALFSHFGVSILSILFFLCNGSLSFIRYFREHPLSSTTILDTITNSKFPAFGPWDGGNISAFWTLNIYTNQRHLALSYALVLGIILMLSKPMKISRRTGIMIGCLTTILLFVNFAAAGICAIFLSWIFVSQKKYRPSLCIAAGMGFITYAFLRLVSHVTSEIVWQPGYLAREPVTLISFVRFWIENLGFHSILIPIGILLSPKHVKRFLGPPLLLLFLLPNLFRFSQDMINNHKFFNFFLIIGNMFSAYAIIRILQQCNRVTTKQLRKPLQLFAGTILIGVLTLSGIIDFFPIINDYKGSVADIAANPDARFIATHTLPTDVIANSTWFYHPASIIGRSLLSGYTYFTWSYGYDQGARENELIRIYEARDQNILCATLAEAHVAYVELNKVPESYIKPNWKLWDTIVPLYENPETHLKLYSTESICKNIPR